MVNPTKKKIVHKAKWQVVQAEGWYIDTVRAGLVSLCGKTELQTFHKRKHYSIGNGSITWKHVTCKKCKKMRKK